MGEIFDWLGNYSDLYKIQIIVPRIGDLSQIFLWNERIFKP